MPVSPQRRNQPGRRLRSGALLGGQDGEEWRPAATFAFPGSPSPKRSNKADKVKSPNNRKLRRQTIMPRQSAAATAFVSPSLSQRRTRRQSMMPVKFHSSPSNVRSKGKAAKTQPAFPDPADHTTKAKTKRKLGVEMEPVEAPPTNKKRRLIPISKSSSQVKTVPSPPTSKKHKSHSSLPVSRSSRKSGSGKPGKTQQNDKVAPSGAPKRAPPATEKVESSPQGKKSPAKKRALSPSHSKALSPTRKKASHPSPGKESSPPKRRAASRSHSESQFVRRKSLPRTHKKATKVPEKTVTPSPKKVVTPQKKASSVRLKAASPATRKPVSPSKNKATTPTAKKTSSTTLKTPPSPKNTPKKFTASLKNATSPATKMQKTPRADSKRKPSSPTKTPPPSNKMPSKKTPTMLTGKIEPTPTKTPPPSQKKSQKKTKADSKKMASTPTKTPPSSHKKTPKRTPTVVSKKMASTPTKTPPSNHKKTPKRTPTVVLKKIKSPTIKTPSSQKKKSLKVTTPSTPSPRRHRLTRSAAKSRMVSTSKSVKHVLLKVDGKSPPSSLASFRKTPSSKNTAAVSSCKDLGASPALPSARVQLQKIRYKISSAKKNRSTHTPACKTQPHTTTTSGTATPSLDKVITKADIHVSGNSKCGSEAALDNHCDPWQGSTPTARPPIPLTPKSSRGNSSSISRFSSRVASSTVAVETCHLQHHTAVEAAPQSRTPIKGSHTLEVIGVRPSLKERKGSGSLPESLEGETYDNVDGEGADTSVEEESVNMESGETSIDENVEEEEEEEEEEEDSCAEETMEAESTTQSRKSFCSLM